MTVVTNAKGINVTLLDATDLTVAANAVAPMGRLTAGEGAPAHLRVVEDVISLPVTFFSATGNYARLCRIPSNAKIKRVVIGTDAALDAAATTGAAAFSVSVGWSDAISDGTPTAFQGTVPSKAKTGVNVAIGNANDNKLFGSVIVPATTAKVPQTDVTFNGDIPATYSIIEILQKGLENLFGFVSLAGYSKRNVGYIDLIIESTVVYTTVPTTAANLFARVEYVV